MEVLPDVIFAANLQGLGWVSHVVADVFELSALLGLAGARRLDALSQIPHEADSQAPCCRLGIGLLFFGAWCLGLQLRGVGLGLGAEESRLCIFELAGGEERLRVPPPVAVLLQNVVRESGQIPAFLVCVG